MIRIFYALVLVIISSSLLYSQSGEIQGKVVNKSDGGIPFANVAVYKNDVLETGAQTDFDGNFAIPALQPGVYDVEASYQGNKYRVTGVVVSTGIVFLDKIVLAEGIKLDDVIIKYERPLVDKGNTRDGGVVTKEDIENIPTREISSIAATTAGVYQQDEGDNNLNIKGSRSDATEYIIDGMRVSGSLRLPQNAIEQLEVITGGVDAKYGDATGGLITVTTRGPSKDYAGGFELITSQFLDPYSYNLANFTVTGPIYTKNKGTDSAKAKLGFFVAGELTYQKDSDPAAIDNYVVRDDVLQNISQQPLTPSQTGTGLNLNSELITLDDLETVDFKQNVQEYGAAINGRVDYKLGKNSNLTLGGTYRYFRGNDYTRTFSLYNSDNNPLRVQSTYRGFARFTQRFPEQKSAEGSSSIFGNAYYSVQFGYTKFKSDRQDEKHKNNAFDYFYVGEYESFRAPVYLYGTDSVSGLNAWLLAGYSDTSVTFQPGTLNPGLANYTQNYFDLTTIPPSSLFDIQLGGGLLNSDLTQNLTVYNLYYNTGVPWFNYSYTDDDRYSMMFNAAVDIKSPKASSSSKHSIEFGFEFDQQINRFYGINAYQLWTIMRQLANRHILTLDVSNPMLQIDGQQFTYNEWLANGQSPSFGEFDSIFYDRRLIEGDQSTFDASLRSRLNELGMQTGELDFINVDALPPDIFSLDMFSADELLNSGNPLVFYNGYDYTGEKLGSEPSFNDFFTERDANGNFTREIGAFRPVYTAGYIQDRFNFNDIIFRIGVRVDRYDANRKVLKDKFSLYDLRSVEEVDPDVFENTYGSGITAAPGNIGADYAVYVDDFTNATPTILGYRDGDSWFNAEGVEVVDPEIIASSSNTGAIQPYLVNSNDDIQDENFDPNSSFVDYEPQITVMPRIAFSFPISKEEGKEALFFAHYDVLTQRPQSRSDATPADYYFFQQTAQGTFENPDLRPEKTIDYQIGFQQQIGENSVVKISAFYRELRDMIQVINVPFAYPVTYNTYGNVDFGTVKGLTFSYDIARRVSNIKLSASYTLQFADGTGSNTTSQLNLVSAGQPNLRAIVPLAFDSRHSFKVVLDYRYGSGESYDGPRWFNKDIFSNAGLNFLIQARSGEPYTKQSNPRPDAQFGVQGRSTLSGSINGSRLPWHFRGDLKIDKRFSIRYGKESKDRSIGMNVYVWVQNIFNNDNIINVYPFTGNPADDGYLASSVGQETIESQVNEQSFIDQYAIKVNDPNNYSLPRRIRLGVQVDF